MMWVLERTDKSDVFACPQHDRGSRDETDEEREADVAPSLTERSYTSRHRDFQMLANHALFSTRFVLET
jgi:hypothetical protein